MGSREPSGHVDLVPRLERADQLHPAVRQSRLRGSAQRPRVARCSAVRTARRRRTRGRSTRTLRAGHRRRNARRTARRLPSPRPRRHLPYRNGHAMGMPTLLVANRGEIAIRVFRTAKRLGYRTVAVYSDADADAPHVRAADAAVRIGPAPAADSYLRVDAIVDAARSARARPRPSRLRLPRRGRRVRAGVRGRRPHVRRSAGEGAARRRRQGVGARARRGSRRARVRGLRAATTSRTRRWRAKRRASGSPCS